MTFRAEILTVSLVCLTLFITSSGVNVPVTVIEPLFRSVGSSDDVAIFTTTTITSIDDCVTLCKSTTSCIFTNYRPRGRVCSLSHNTGTSSFNVAEDKTAGFVSWARLNTTEVDCLSCNAGQSCVERSGGTCEQFACGKPRINQNRTIYGNIYTINGKLAYQCYNHSSNRLYLQISVCSGSGEWSNMLNICGYTTHNLSDGVTFSLKIFDLEVNQSTAFDNCAADGASLITVLTLEKLDYLRTLFVGSGADGYWVDTMRVGMSNDHWVTSKGTNQTMTNDIWREYALNPDGNDHCARLYERNSWQLNDIQCYTQYGYICEIPAV